MSSKPLTASADVIGQVAVKLTRLPEADLKLVVDLIKYLDLEEKRPGGTPSGARLSAEAKRRAALLRDVPREQLVARFAALAEEVRQEAVEKGTAADGDWVGD